MHLVQVCCLSSGMEVWARIKIVCIGISGGLKLALISVIGTNLNVYFFYNVI